MRNKIISALAALAFAGSAFAATDAPDGYTKCAQVGDKCTMSGTHKVALGKSGTFYYANITGSFTCDQSLFPSNSLADSAWCSVGAVVASASSSAAASSKAAVSSAAAVSSKAAVSSAAAVSSKAAVSSAASTGSSSLCVNGATIDGITVDCGGKTIGNSTLSCLSDDEGQLAALTLKNGAVVKNVHIKAGASGHGVSCTAGSCTLENVTWDEVCEHAAGMYSEGGTYSILNSTAYQNLDSLAIDGNTPDKFFQDNAYNSKLYIRNFTAIMVETGSLAKSGKILRTCGDCSVNKGGRTLDMDGLTVKHVAKDRVTRVSGPGISTIVGINTTWDSGVPSPYNVADKAILRNIKIQDYKSGSPAVCDTYVGSRTHNGSTKIGEKWNTASCNVTTSDVTSF